VKVHWSFLLRRITYKYYGLVKGELVESTDYESVFRRLYGRRL
jgi:hypothetical protein